MKYLSQASKNWPNLKYMGIGNYLIDFQRIIKLEYKAKNI